MAVKACWICARGLVFKTLQRQLFAFCIFLCAYKHELVHSMYVPGIYTLWTSSKQVCTRTCIYIHFLVHSMYVPGIYILWTSSKQVCTQTWIYIHFLSLSEEFPSWMPFVRVCTHFVIGIDNAMVQEFAHLYIHCHAVYIPPKNGSGRWSAFL